LIVTAFHSETTAWQFIQDLAGLALRSSPPLDAEEEDGG
jgi:hypothetical protein